MSALPPKADIETQSRNVRFVPKADIAQLILLEQLGYLDRDTNSGKDGSVDNEKAEAPSNKSVQPRSVIRGGNRRPDHYDTQ